jgi:hypothetical protein
MNDLSLYERSVTGLAQRGILFGGIAEWPLDGLRATENLFIADRNFDAIITLN